MTMADVAAQITRLGQYNSAPVSGANPYGLAADGHVTNFPAACADLAAVAAEVGDAAAAVTALGSQVQLAPAWRNLIINPVAAVRPRGPGPFTTADGLTGACMRQQGASLSSSLVDTLPPGGPAGITTGVAVTISALSPAVYAASWSVEGADTLAGRTVTVSMWVHATVAGQIRAVVQRYWGSGGSGAFPLAFTGAWRPVAAGWQRLSWTTVLPAITTEVLGPGHHIRVHVNTAGGDWGGGPVTLTVTGVQIEEGPAATPIEVRPLSVERQLAARFVQTTYLNGTAPATVAAPGALAAQANASGLVFPWRWPVEMRAAPSLVTYRPDAGSGAGTSATPASLAVTPVGLSAASVLLQAAAGATAGNIYTIHALASAEL